MKNRLVFVLLLLFYSCSPSKNSSSKAPLKHECAITSKELIAWIYKNRMQNEKVNHFPNNRVSVVIFDDLKKNQHHFMNGIHPNDTIIESSIYSDSQKNLIGYRGITTLLDDTILIFDNYDIGEKYYCKQLLQNYPQSKIPVAKAKSSKGLYFVCISVLYPENGQLKLWSK